jgi:hypothetical protein
MELPRSSGTSSPIAPPANPRGAGRELERDRPAAGPAASRVCSELHIRSPDSVPITPQPLPLRALSVRSHARSGRDARAPASIGCNVVALLLLLASIASGFGATLVPTGATWRWRPGTNEASNPIPAWRQPGFADTQFAPAPAPFWYGDPLPGGTQITGMRDIYRCLFLRRTFTITDLAQVAGLRLGALVDDGFVAWINGTEVLRVGLPGPPGSEVTVATLADNAAEPVAFATYPLPNPSAYLLPGTNVLAVQVFQSNISSSDLGFDAALDSVLADKIPPVVLRTLPAPGETLDRLAGITVTFSEPVTGVVAAHLLVNGIGAASVSALDEATYAFTFAPPAYGPVAIAWNRRQTIVDRAEPPNPFDADGPGATWQYTLVDRTPPYVAGLSPAGGATVRRLESITVAFAESVAGVETSDLLVDGHPATGLTRIAASEYVFTFPQPPTGLVTVAWAAGHGITDEASPPNPFPGGSWTYRLDPDAAEQPPYLSEFLASNTRGLKDETGQYADWIEIHNPSDAPLDLTGWALTDSADNLAKWRFPATNLAARGFLVVFASGQDRRVPGARLHTGFQLAADGEYLALVRPDGITVVDEYAPTFPQQVPDVSFGVAQIPRDNGWEAGPRSVYFTQPTPGAPNLGGSAVPGPLIQDVGHSPQVPREDEDLLVTATVRPSFRPVAAVALRYRIMFGAEAETPMLDDGAHGDGLAGDGLFGATIPASLSTNGQMIRYRVAASDVAGGASRWPLFTQPTASEEYLGTLVEPTNAVSNLPVFHLFVAPGQMNAIDTESGGRVAFFHDGEFYDNVYMELRGNTSAGLRKKNHRLEFNRGHELRHAGPGGRTRKSSLLAEYLDPAYLRQHLCFWFLDRIGVPAPFDYPVRVQMNGQFYQLAFHGDVIGQEQMERMGYDPRGALYKAVGNLTPNFSSTGVFQKLEPDGDPTRTDYLQLANGINESASTAVRRRTVFDLLDVPQVINHLAGARWCAENDDVWANMSLYRDTFGDGLWRCIPFDMNASWGQLYGGSNPLEATVDSTPKATPSTAAPAPKETSTASTTSSSNCPKPARCSSAGKRSILDQMVQPPETPAESRLLETHIRQMAQLIAPEAALDRAQWGNSPWAPGKTFDGGIGDLLNQFVGPRRRHWYVTHSITNTSRPLGITSAHNAGIPLAQPTNAALALAALDFNPASGNQAEEFIALRNDSPLALDLSGWRLDGAIDFTFRPGTVVPSNGVIHLSPDVRQFRARTTGPRGGQGLFVVGPYLGQLSARGESLELRDAQGRSVANFAYPGTPSPAQQFLRVTELMFHPAPLAGNPADPDEFEFLELRNLSPDTPLDLAGVHFAAGVEFAFSGSAVTRLDPGARVLVVANPVAFAARYGTHLPVAGQYLGRLDNSGERLRLLDAAHEEILDFTFDDAWNPSTDGEDFALVVIDENADPDAWSQRSQWRAGSAAGGTPGRPESPAPPPDGTPLIVVQPVSQDLLPGAPLVLTLVLDPTTALPLGIQVLRNGNPFLAGPDPRLAGGPFTWFLSLPGTDASPPWTEFSFLLTNALSPGGVASAPARIAYLPDTDADGLADPWETAAFGSLAADPLADPDADGANNREESVAGTDPTDPRSRMGIEGFSAPPGLLLRFLAVSNRTYTVQFTHGLEAPAWRTLADVPAHATNRTLELADPESPSRRAYRLVTPRQP